MANILQNLVLTVCYIYTSNPNNLPSDVQSYLKSASTETVLMALATWSLTCGYGYSNVTVTQKHLL